MTKDELNQLNFDDLLDLMSSTVNEIMRLPKTEGGKAQVREKNKLLRLIVAKTKQIQLTLR